MLNELTITFLMHSLGLTLDTAGNFVYHGKDRDFEIPMFYTEKAIYKSISKTNPDTESIREFFEEVLDPLKRFLEDTCLPDLGSLRKNNMIKQNEYTFTMFDDLGREHTSSVYTDEDIGKSLEEFLLVEFNEKNLDVSEILKQII